MGKSKTFLDNIPLKTTLSIYPINLITRFRLPKAYLVNPYIDVLGGAHYIETNTKYNNSLAESIGNTINEENTKELYASANSSSYTYGLGFGVSLRLKPYGEGHFDFGLRYLNGGSAKYVSPEDLRVNNQGNYYYMRSEVSSTDMLYFHVGISGHF